MELAQWKINRFAKNGYKHFILTTYCELCSKDKQRLSRWVIIDSSSGERTFLCADHFYEVEVRVQDVRDEPNQIDSA